MFLHIFFLEQQQNVFISVKYFVRLFENRKNRLWIYFAISHFKISITTKDYVHKIMSVFQPNNYCNCLATCNWNEKWNRYNATTNSRRTLFLILIFFSLSFDVCIGLLLMVGACSNKNKLSLAMLYICMDCVLNIMMGFCVFHGRSKPHYVLVVHNNVNTNFCFTFWIQPAMHLDYNYSPLFSRQFSMHTYSGIYSIAW